ncbi:MAG: IS1595 family transposase [Alphaproteobacteria bacterium]
MNHLKNPIFQDENKARQWLEARIWPEGPFCPHCGEREAVTALKGKQHRPSLYQCNSCRQQFTVTVGTIFERSKIPLNTWLLATYLLCASKKGMSTRQLSRMLGVSVKSTWFMMHRIREAMRDNPDLGPLGGENKVVEADETFVGGKAKNAKRGKPVPKKEAVVSLIERDGNVRSFHLPAVSRNTLRPILVSQIDRKSFLMTDEAGYYKAIGCEYAGHGTVNHSIDEYVRGVFWHTNTIEGYFSILKRGITGVYQHVSQQHLKRYLGEFDFRYNTREQTDMDRTAQVVQGAWGKRLTYRRTNVGTN